MIRYLFAISLVLPLQAVGLGLGEHQVNSYLNQPLSLQIPLIDSDGLTPEQISISVADDFYYEQAGLEKAASHNDLSFNVVNRGGQLFVDVTTRSAIKEPYINFITKVDMPNGRVLKEITVLLDPPAFDEPSAPAPISVPQTPSQPVAPVVQAPVVSEPVYVEPVYSEPVVSYDVPSNDVMDLPIAQTFPIESGESTVYSAPTYSEPVYSAPSYSTFDNYDAAPSYSSTIFEGGSITTQQGDRLWEIAQELSGGYHDIQQTLVAIVQKNPHAFVKGNMNRLKANVTLDLPTADEIARVGMRSARQKYRSDLAEFSEVRSTTLSSVVEEKPVESVSTGKGEVTLKTGTEAGGSQESDLLAEDLTRAKSENAELKSRVGELNEILAAGEKSLTIQDQELASLEQRLKELNGGELPAAAQATAATTAEQPAVAAAPTPANIPKPAKPAGSLLDTIKPFLLPLLLLIPLIGGLLFYRKRKSETINDSPFETDVAISDLVMDEADAEQVAEELTKESGSVLEDVDRLLSYSLEDKATELLEDELEKEPNRQDYRLKLAQLYVDMERKDDFTRISAPLLESSDAGMRNRVQLMQTKLGLERSMNTDVLMDEEPAVSASVDAVADVATDSVESFDVDLGGDATADFDLDLDLGLDTDAQAPVADAAADEGFDLDLDTDLDLGGDLELGEGLDLDVGLAETQADDDSLSLDTSELDLSIDSATSEIAEHIDDTESLTIEPTDTETLDFDIESLEDETVEEIDFILDDNADDVDAAEEIELSDVDDVVIPDAAAEAFDISDAVDSADEALDLGDLSDALGDDVEDISLDFDDVASADVVDVDVPDVAADMTPDVAAPEVAVPEVAVDAAESDELSALDNEFGFLDDLDENETKLDLAKAYLEMGDQEEAKEILEEVIAEGNDTQKARAQEMLEQC